MRRWGAVCIAGVGVAALAVLYWFNPAESGIYPKCPLYAATGLYCPGCGSLRGLHCLVHGNLAGALARNPLMVVSIPFLVALMLRPRLGARVWVPWACLVVLVVYGVLRNVPAWPFSLLAPH